MTVPILPRLFAALLVALAAAFRVRPARRRCR